ncbi:MAG: phage portal protein [Solirubrobacteraceae bacterium]
MAVNVIDPAGQPVEIAKGRGDLRYSSTPIFSQSQNLALIGGKTVSYANLFAEQPMIAAAVMRMLTWSVRVPLKVYRRTGDDSRERLRPADHPLAAAIAAPWDRGSQIDLTMSLLGPLLVHGNALNTIENGAGNTISFGRADWRHARAIMPWRDSIAGWKIDIDDPTIRRTVGTDTALHVAWWSACGPLGTSPLLQLGTTLGIEDAAQRHQRAMLSNGARPPSAIMASAEFLGLKPAERQALMEQLRADVSDIYSGPENSGRPALLPPGLSWEQVGHTAVEAELIRQRIVAREEIGAVYMIPPACIGLGLDKGSDIGEQRTSGYVDGLAPVLILIEQAINSQIVRALLREDDVFCEYDLSGLLRGNRLAEVEALRESIATALMTPNEGRAILNMPQSDLDGMNDHWMPRNNLVKISVPYQGTPKGSDGLPEE